MGCLNVTTTIVSTYRIHHVWKCVNTLFCNF
nr:MAG TPA: hypothetical protein [Caudoviricetes sp.]